MRPVRTTDARKKKEEEKKKREKALKDKQARAAQKEWEKKTDKNYKLENCCYDLEKITATIRKGNEMPEAEKAQADVKTEIVEGPYPTVPDQITDFEKLIGN